MTGRKRVAAVGRWTAEKLELLRCYLGGGTRGFLPATRSAQQRYYIDLFAGPGQNQIEGTDVVVDGSPLIALKAGPPHFTRLFFVDSHSGNLDSLEAHRAEHPSRDIALYHGDANEKVDDILRLLPREYPVFAFLDPRGAELHWRTVLRLAQHKPNRKIELFILFAYNQGLVRLMPYDPSKMRHEGVLDLVMPNSARWRDLYQRRVYGETNRHEFRRAMLEEYVRGLRSLGYAFVPPPRLVRMPNNRSLYFLIFASDHEAGGRIMEWCLKSVRDSSVQRSYLSYEQQY